MAHFAELDQNNIVIRVIVVSDEHEADGENWCANLLGGRWKQTSYNKRIRKNYAGQGYTYDEARDSFIPPKPFSSWILDEETCSWNAPVAKPEGMFYRWSEDTQEWINTFPLAKYGLDSDYSKIEHIVQKYNLINFGSAVTFSNDDFVLKVQRVNNLIFFHADIINYNKTVQESYRIEVDKLHKEIDTDIYSYSQYAIEDNVAEVDKLTKFAQMFGGEIKEDYVGTNDKTYRILIRTKDKIV